MTFALLKCRIWQVRYQIRCRTMTFVLRYAWFRRFYSWYFRRFKFNENYEYGDYKVVGLADLYDDNKIRKIFDWQIKLIPEGFRDKIQYIRSKSQGLRRDTIGWMYSPEHKKAG